MVNHKEFDEHIQEILSEMCKRVGTTIEDVDFQTDNWFKLYEWTEEEQEDFKNWLIDYLYVKNKSRKVIATNPIKNKKHLEKIADWFIFNYGWKIKNR